MFSIQSIPGKMQFERIPNARSQRFLTDVHTHKLTATLPVYPLKKKKSALKQTLEIRQDGDIVCDAPGSITGDASVSQYNIVIVVIYNIPINM